MNKTLSLLFLLAVLLAYGSPASAEALSKEKQKQAVETIKEYCQLMQEFSGDVEKIDNLEKITAMCENSNVSVFNDLIDASARDISLNSMPLQQYMMLLTDQFENNVKTTYSGYQYLKSVVQPSPLKEFEPTTFAFVKVDKQLTAPGINSKLHLNVVVNTATMKVSSTISEDYEDPQRIYLEGLEKFNDGNYAQAIPLFAKVSELPRFSGRYRAQTMLGWSYAHLKEFQKANDALRLSSLSDPLGSVILASQVLMREDVPASLRNYTEGLDILQKTGGNRSSDFPIHLIAKSALFDAATDMNNYGQKVNLDNLDLNKLSEELLNDSETSDVFRVRGLVGKTIIYSYTDDKSRLEEAKQYVERANELLKTTRFDRVDFERLNLWVLTSKVNIYQKLGDTNGSQAAARELVETPYAARFLADSWVIAGTNLKTALEYYHKAAEKGDAHAAYIVSLNQLALNEPFSGITERVWFNELLRMKDYRIVKGWPDFVELLIDTSSRDNAEFLRWNQKAIELSEVNAMEDRAVFLTFKESPIGKIDIPQALTLACKAACMGLRTDTYKLFLVHSTTKNLEEQANIPFESSQTYKTLKALSDDGNGAASYLLALDLEEKDLQRAQQYLQTASDQHCFYAMHTVASNLLESGQYEQAFDLFNQLTIYPKSLAYNHLGDIERDYRHDDNSAMKYYLAGCKERDYMCSEAISDMFKEGRLGGRQLKTDNFTAARAYIREALSFYKVYSTFAQVDEEDPTLKRLQAKEATLDSLIALGTNSNTNAAATPIAQLNTLLDATQGEDERIVLSESLLQELFISPKAVVITMGTNGMTIVAKETAEDFLLRMATIKTDKRLAEVSSKKDKDGKYSELTVRME